MVEAAGVEPEISGLRNFLMARHFWVNLLNRWRLTPFALFTDVLSSPRVST
jgi:hypothetical protein